MAISEKTLELNVSENLVNVFRSQGSPSAFLEGVTLRNEKTSGLDVSVHATGRFMGLQFKKPLSYDSDTYRFEINTNKDHDQHIKLFAHALAFQQFFSMEPIFYAFPTFYDMSEVSANSPDFLEKTYFVNPLNMPVEILDRNFHVVEIDIVTDQIEVYSKRFKIETVYKGKKVIDVFNEESKDFENLKIKRNTPREKKITYKELLKKTSKNSRYYEALKKKEIKEIFDYRWNVRIQGIVL